MTGAGATSSGCSSPRVRISSTAAPLDPVDLLVAGERRRARVPRGALDPAAPAARDRRLSSKDADHPRRMRERRHLREQRRLDIFTGDE